MHGKMIYLEMAFREERESEGPTSILVSKIDRCALLGRAGNIAHLDGAIIAGLGASGKTETAGR